MFSRILKSITLLVVMVGFVYANNAPSHSVVDGYYNGRLVNDIRTTAAWDTLTAATDSMTILSNFSPEWGKEYILQIAPLTGSGIDTSELIVTLNAEDNSGNSFGLYYCTDSIVGSVNKSGYIRLPMLSACFGNRFDIKLRCTNTGATQIIVNRVRLWSRWANITAREKDIK